MRITKQEKILNYLTNHKEGITSLEAFKLFNITRLSAIIFELRHRYRFTIVNQDLVTADGTHFARYILVDKGDNNND